MSQTRPLSYRKLRPFAEFLGTPRRASEILQAALALLDRFQAFRSTAVSSAAHRAGQDLIAELHLDRVPTALPAAQAPNAFAPLAPVTCHPAYLGAVHDAADTTDEYVTICPFCGADAVRVTGCVVDCDLPLCRDGYSFGEGETHESNERFACRVCQKAIPAAYLVVDQAVDSAARQPARA